MIETVDKLVQDWIESVVGPKRVSLGPPGATVEGDGIGLFLLDVLAAPPARGAQVPPLQVSVRYLVTAHAKDPRAEHKLLGDLLFAAMEPASKGRPELEVDLTPPQPEFWSALGVAPRPCFIVRLPLRKERPQKRPTMVRQPLRLEGASMVDLSGRVVGPGDVPLSDVEVEITGLQRWTRTDAAGGFVLRSIPAQPRTRTFVVRVKGQVMTFTSEQPTHEPLVIHCKFPEP